MTAPINLMTRFGDRFKVTFDPVVDPYGKQRDKIDPMLQVLKCRIASGLNEAPSPAKAAG